MLNNNKKPVFGTLSAVTLFLVTFLIVFVLLIWIILKLVLHTTGGDGGGFGSGIIIAIAVVPTLIVAAIMAWLIASTGGKKFHDKVTPENKTSGMVLWGLGMVVPGWIIGLLVWSSQTSSPKPKILIPAIVSVLLQVAALSALGLLGKSNDRTRRKAWGTLSCIAVLIIPIVVLKIAAR